VDAPRDARFTRALGRGERARIGTAGLSFVAAAVRRRDRGPPAPARRAGTARGAAPLAGWAVAFGALPLARAIVLSLATHAPADRPGTEAPARAALVRAAPEDEARDWRELAVESIR
jgi:hypothetical protein